MFRYVTFGLIALLQAAVAPQATAQEANPEPGYCAQYYPDRDCNTINLPARPPEKTAAPEPRKTEPARKKHHALK
jgi:hypothetical protein